MPCVSREHSRKRVGPFKGFSFGPEGGPSSAARYLLIFAQTSSKLPAAVVTKWHRIFTNYCLRKANTNQMLGATLWALVEACHVVFISGARSYIGN
jgi:hypothetical protein